MMSLTYGTYSTVIPIEYSPVIQGTYAIGEPCAPQTGVFGPYEAEMPQGSTVEYPQSEEAQFRHADTSGSWAKVLRSGKVKMTEMTAMRSHVTRSPYYSPEMACVSKWPWKQYTSCCGHAGLKECVALWYNVGHIDRPQMGLEMKQQIANHKEELRDLIVVNQQDLYRDLNEGFDLATELGELPETYGWLSSLVQQMVSATDKFPDLKESRGPSGRRVKLPRSRREALKMGSYYTGKLLDRWMEYRYAVMPIVYSVRDVQKVLRFADRLVRKGSKPENASFAFEEVNDDGNSVPLKIEYVLDTDVVSTGRILYKTGSLNRFVDQVSTNLLITAWELLPLSFVLGWLFNVSNSIFAATHFDNQAFSSGYCTSVKQRESVIARQVGTKELVYERQYPGTLCPNSGFLHRIDRSMAYPSRTVYSQESQTYTRTVWTRPTGKIVFDPYLDWKRILDAVALTHKPVHKRLSRL
jgi:hypothetical protein